jgi:hypothetical protein
MPTRVLSIYSRDAAVAPEVRWSTLRKEPNDLRLTVVVIELIEGGTPVVTLPHFSMRTGNEHFWFYEEESDQVISLLSAEQRNQLNGLIHARESDAR